MWCDKIDKVRWKGDGTLCGTIDPSDSEGNLYYKLNIRCYEKFYVQKCKKTLERCLSTHYGQKLN